VLQPDFGFLGSTRILPDDLTEFFIYFQCEKMDLDGQARTGAAGRVENCFPKREKCREWGRLAIRYSKNEPKPVASI
jgi:hypothetical protein